MVLLAGVIEVDFIFICKQKQLFTNKNNFGPQIDKCTIEFEKCAVKCVDKHIGLIPGMMKSMKKVLASGKPPPVSNE